MDDWKLIELVRKNQLIYNKFDCDYKKPELKGRVWAAIAQEMETTVDLCMRRWTSLRDRYVRECRRADAPSGSATSCRRPWAFFDSMHFLKPHIAVRPVRCTENVCDPLVVGSHESSKSLSELFVSTPLWSPVESDSLGALSSGIDENLKESAKKRRSNEADNEFSEAVRAFKSVCEARQQQLNAIDPVVQSFGQTLISLISGMSERHKTRAMKAAVDAVLAIKMEEDDA